MSQQNPIPDPAQVQPPQAKEDKRPSERDLEIYRAVRIHLQRQKTVATLFELTTGRISQIVKEVSRHLARLFPGEDLKMRFAEAKRARLMDYECHERRVELFRQNQLVFEQSARPLIDEQRTYEGPEEPKSLVKTVVKKRAQAHCTGALREMRRLNNELQWGGGSAPRSATQSGRGGERARGRGNQGAAVIEKLPPPECLTPEDRAQWPKLMREEQELAAKRLKIWPKISLDAARVPAGPLWSYYPWRTEAEHNAALLASMVIKGYETIEEYYRNLEILELSKPFAHPNLLTKDKEGRWQYIEPRQVPLPVMPPERAALPEGSPERLYWPNKSKAEHYAMMRAEMVLRGHLSRDQYERLNAWASWYMNEKYPDPLAKCAEKFNSGGEAKREGDGLPLAGTKPGPGVLADDEGAPDSGSRVEPSSLARPPGPGLVPAIRGVLADDDASPATGSRSVSSYREDTAERRDSSPADPAGQTRLARRLASGRRMSPVERRRLEGLAARRGAG